MKPFILILMVMMTADSTMTLKSGAFEDNHTIPVKYSCDGSNINPPLNIQGMPMSTKSLALIVDDPDAPNGTFDHWIMWNIPPKDKIEENSAPGVQGKNGKGENKYTGPCPPNGTHHYHFKIFALDKMLDLSSASGKKELENAMQGHILSSAELIGLFERKK